ncbi:MAG: ribonucleotide-diphosphate reductase subunit beta [Kangiellaceae bacterium]|nr:ribonucleotide-diphosphate reductase subunit beta [Kangiellaceae bacterium]
MLDWNDPISNFTTSKEQDKKIVTEQALENKNVDGQSPVLFDSIDSLKPVDVNDKRIVNGTADINQLAPFKYPWAWNFFLNANKNHWTPLDINMTKDVQDYHQKLSAEEKHLYENVLSYLTTSDILAMRNVGLAVMEKMSAPELQIYQARQVYEEALHTWTYQHCIESIGLEQSEIYNRYRVVPQIYRKINLANQRLSSVLKADIDLTDADALDDFVHSYLFFAGVFEGCWFYNGFSPIFALQRRGLMTGTAEQLQYIMRDEVLHCAFGIRVVNELVKEENLTLDESRLKLMWQECEAAEIEYAKYLLPEPILGYSAEEHIEQFRFIANRRAKQLNISEPFPGAANRLDWLDEQANMRKEKNFFETRVTEYQTGAALSWD